MAFKRLFAVFQSAINSAVVVRDVFGLEDPLTGVVAVLVEGRALHGRVLLLNLRPYAAVFNPRVQPGLGIVVKDCECRRDCRNSGQVSVKVFHGENLVKK